MFFYSRLGARFFVPGIGAAGLSLVFSARLLATGISLADSVVSYTPGDFTITNTSASFQNPSAALGALSGDTSFGGLTPFNPAFEASQIVAVGAGGSLTLHLSNPVPGNGQTLGVVANNGLIDVSADGSGEASSPAATFSSASEAIVSVSADGVTYQPLNGGQPITFDNPANYYLDQPIVSYEQALGTVTSFQQKPFLGNLQSFAGETYEAMKTTLNGSAGGTWVDTSAAGLPAINYVRFTVPAAATYRMVVDSVAGMTAAEPIVPGQSIISESVGSGANTSYIVTDFGPQSFEFAVHYDGSISGEQALELLQSDSMFRLGLTHFSFGDLVSEMDYGGYDFSGEGNNGNDYWSYYTGNGSSWASSGEGAGDRMLSNGSFDGWVWAANQSTAPDFPTAVPEPVGFGSLVVVTGLVARRRRI